MTSYIVWRERFKSSCNIFKSVALRFSASVLPFCSNSKYFASNSLNNLTWLSNFVPRSVITNYCFGSGFITYLVTYLMTYLMIVWGTYDAFGDFK